MAITNRVFESEVDYRFMPQYKEGFDTFNKTGTVNHKCPDGPYKKGDKKTAWIVGWLDARTDERFNHGISKHSSKEKDST